MAPSSTPKYVGAASNSHAMRADGSLTGLLSETVERNTATDLILQVLLRCCFATPSATAPATARDNATQPRTEGRNGGQGWRERISLRLLCTRGFVRRECLRTDRADAPPFVVSVHTAPPSGSLALQKEDWPRPGRKPGGVPAANCSCRRVVTTDRHSGAPRQGRDGWLPVAGTAAAKRPSGAATVGRGVGRKTGDRAGPLVRAARRRAGDSRVPASEGRTREGVRAGRGRGFGLRSQI